jgi:SOS-response transcriptional repressor LexA
MVNRDDQHLAKLRDYYADHQVLPSYGGIARLLGFSSTAAVTTMVKRMKAVGYLDSTPDRRLQPGTRFFECVLADTIQAGQPQPAHDVPAVTFDLVRRLIRTPSRTVLLRVTGESMIDAGLLPGDYVVVLKGTPAKVDDIVVAVVDREFTIKYLAEDRGGYYLRPGNREYRDIRPEESLELFGVVTGSFREYRK